MAGIIAIVVVMIIINAFMVYAIIGAWERVNEKISKFFLDRTSSFILKKETDVEKQDTNEVTTKETVIVKTQPIYIAPNNKSNTVYKSKEFKDDYKSLKEEMSFNKNEVISNVVQTSPKNISSYGKTAINLKESFSFETIYKLSTLESLKQEEILRNCFEYDENELLDKYLSTNKSQFSAIDFFDYVNQIAKAEDPIFYVKTGWKDDNFNNIDKKVVTVHDDDITEGVKIVHKNKLYDYSV